MARNERKFDGAAAVAGFNDAVRWAAKTMGSTPSHAARCLRQRPELVGKVLSIRDGARKQLRDALQGRDETTRRTAPERSTTSKAEKTSDAGDKSGGK